MSAQPEMDKQSKMEKQLAQLEADISSDESLKARLLEQPLSMLKEYGIPVSDEAKSLNDEELQQITGGMKYDPNYVSANVIDARGGQLTIYGVTFTLDINGKISSVSGK